MAKFMASSSLNTLNVHPHHKSYKEFNITQPSPLQPGFLPLFSWFSCFHSGVQFQLHWKFLGLSLHWLPGWKAVLTSQWENFFPNCPKSNLMWFCIFYFTMFCHTILISEHLASNWIDYKTSQAHKRLF